MAFSYVTYNGNGVERAFTFSFSGQEEGYIRESDIGVFVDGDITPFTLTSSNTLEVSEAPSEGAEVIIRRVMPNQTPYADFSSGNNFGAEVLNNSFLQLLYLVHELLDGWFPSGFTVREAVDYIEGLRSLKPDPEDPQSVLNFGEGDKRYLALGGGSMEGPLSMGNNPISVRPAVGPTEAVRKSSLDAEASARQQADSNLQRQLSGAAPLEASAFSPISWHDQEISSSVSIPANKNAWSFGPVVTIAPGQAVTVGPGSVWTIANGDAEAVPTLDSYDGGEL